MGEELTDLPLQSTPSDLKPQACSILCSLCLGPCCSWRRCKNNRDYLRERRPAPAANWTLPDVALKLAGTPGTSRAAGEREGCQEEGVSLRSSVQAESTGEIGVHCAGRRQGALDGLEKLFCSYNNFPSFWMVQ